MALLENILFSERYKFCSSIDMISTSKNLANKILIFSLITTEFFWHLEKKSLSYRWGLNESILQKETIAKDYKKKFNEYFDNNLGIRKQI